MTAAAKLAKIVRVEITRDENGFFVAKSPDLKGLLALSDSMVSLEQIVTDHIRDLYLACGERVLVTPVDDAEAAPHRWVAVPLAAIESQEAAA